MCEEERVLPKEQFKSRVIEMNQAQRSDDYNTFAVKAATVLKLNVAQTYKCSEIIQCQSVEVLWSKTT